jgi:excisionase family DNA binding protein
LSRHLIKESTISHVAETAHERLWNIQQAARYLAVSVSTLYGWVWQRRIPFVKMGRALRFDPSDLENFIETSKQRPRKESSTTQPSTRFTIRGAAGKE